MSVIAIDDIYLNIIMSGNGLPLILFTDQCLSFSYLANSRRKFDLLWVHLPHLILNLFSMTYLIVSIPARQDIGTASADIVEKLNLYLKAEME